jgi:ATP-dependent helicase/DNAse subunit B
MTATVTLCTGPVATGKTTYLLQRYRQALAQSSPGAALWLAPTQRSAADVRGRLLDAKLDACFSPGVMTFDQFADALLRYAPYSIRPVSTAMKRRLLQSIVEQALAAGQIVHFAPIAQTSGFLSLLESCIADLKRDEIWPQQLEDAWGQRASDRECELAFLYGRYQQLLQQHQLYDPQGRFWTARTLLREGQRRPFERLRFVVADGFTDFTTTQHEILEILAEWLDELFVSLPLDESDARGLLFSKTRQTLRRLQRALPQLRQQRFAPQGEGLAADLRHIERQLFTPPARAQRRTACDSLTCIAAASPLRELEVIARQIKTLLLAGVPASDILVVFRSLQRISALVEEVFTEYGIPFVIEQGRPLSSFPAVAALVSFLRLEVEDWPYRQVLAAVGNNFYRPSPHGSSAEVHLAAAERVVHDLQLPGGRGELLQRIRQLAQSQTPQSDDAAEPTRQPSERRRRIGDARLALPILEELASRLDILPQRATPGDWAAALVTFAKQSGFQESLVASGDPPSLTAWQRLLEVLNEQEWLTRQLGDAPVLLTRAQMLNALVDLLAHEQVFEPGDDAGRVRVLNATSARNLRAPYLFVAGLTEDAFPRRLQESLLRDADHEKLGATGLGRRRAEEHAGDEMLLFYELVTRADKHLFLSYPALDDAAGPLLPSPYLLEIEQLFDDGAMKRLDATNPHPLFALDSPVLSPAEARTKGVAEAIAGEPALLRDYVHQINHPVAENVLAGLVMAHDRQGRQFTSHEGLLSRQRIAAALATRFPSDFIWSTTLLEGYALCPFRFFVERVLEVIPLSEVVIDIDAAERGRWMHHALASLHRALNARERRPVSPAAREPAETERHIRQALAALAANAEDEGKLMQTLRDIMRLVLCRWGDRYHEQHAKYDQYLDKLSLQLLPRHFEVSFGIPGAAGELDHELPLEIRSGDEVVRISGRIDRIDVGFHGEQPVFSVIDYKTGRPPKSKGDAPIDPTALQLEVYALAVEQLLLKNDQAVPAVAGYWNVKQGGFKPALTMWDASGRQPQVRANWLRRCEELIRKIFELVHGIRRGEFPVFSLDDECTSYCPYRTVCRVNQVRALDKQWPSEAAT